MKVVVRKLYQELVEQIDFPALVYIYETGRMIAINNSAKDILGTDNISLGKLCPYKQNSKFDQEVLKQDSKIYYNLTFNNHKEEKIQVDVESNVIEVDNKHILILLFNHCYKQSFVKHLKQQMPRIYWKNRQLQFVGGNSAMREDAKHQIVFGKNMINETVFDENTSYQLTEDEKHILSMKEGQYHSLQLIKTPHDLGYFTFMSRIPIINKNGSVTGLIVVYSLVFNREEYKHLFDVTIRENNILSEIISKSDSIIATWKKSEICYTEYISPNISHLGYTVEEIYNNVVTLETLIHPADVKQLNHVLNEFENGNYEGQVIEVRIFDSSRNPIWMKATFEPVIKNNELYCIQCIFQDISEKKLLEQQLKSSEEALKYYKQYDSIYNRRTYLDRQVNNNNKYKELVDGREQYLRKAIIEDYDEFEVYYQPIVDSGDTHTIGVEALLRWTNSELGIMCSSDFISMSEYLGLIVPLGEYVLKESFTLMSQIEAPINLHINLSIIQLVQPNIIERIKQVAQKLHISNHQIVFEVKESLAIEDMTLMRNLIETFQKEGFLIALDNFGSGFFSVQHMVNMPFDYIKLDRNFMACFDKKKFNERMYLAILEMANSLNMKVIVEGVENEEQVKFLSQQKIEAYEGYYFAKPMPKDDFIQYLKNKNEIL